MQQALFGGRDRVRGSEHDDNVAGFQATVVWQVPHASLLGRCVACLPVAVVPLWQLEQLPITCA